MWPSQPHPFGSGNRFLLTGENCALGRINEGYGSRFFLINRKGEIVSSGWRLADDFSEGLALVATRDVDPLYGYIAKDGKYVIQHQFWSANSFSEGMASVKTPANKWGFIVKWGGPQGTAHWPSSGLTRVLFYPLTREHPATPRSP